MKCEGNRHYYNIDAQGRIALVCNCPKQKRRKLMK